MKAPIGLRDEELLARVWRRDVNAIGDLYDRHAPKMLGILLRILSDRAKAGEVLANTFVQLWNEARKLKSGPASVGVWLAVAARWNGVDRLRAERRLPRLPRPKPAPLEKSANWLPAPEEIALVEERLELLRKVINQLPSPQRQAIEMVLFEGYTEAEIAQRLGEPLGKVKTRLRAGLSFLRHRLHAVLGTWVANI